MKQKIILDFDGTFTQVEALDELAKIALNNNENKEKVVKQIEETTKLGMEGSISFEESLSKRISLIGATKKDIQTLIEFLRNRISKTIIENKDFFIENSKNIIIISGGFKEFIIPITNEFNIPKENIYANDFIFENDAVIGYNKENPLSTSNGKSTIIKNLNETNGASEYYAIGDGYTDYMMKKTGVIKYFFAYTENFKRDNVIEKADYSINSFNEFLEIFNEIKRK